MPFASLILILKIYLYYLQSMFTLVLFYRAKLENQIRLLENPHQIYDNQNNETSENTQVFFLDTLTLHLIYTIRFETCF